MILVRLTALVTWVFAAPVEVPDGKPSAELNWFKHNVQVFSELVGALYGVHGIGLALERLITRSTSDHQLNLLTNILIEYRDKTDKYETFKSFIAALDSSITPLGLDLATVRPTAQSVFLQVVRTSVREHIRSWGVVDRIEQLDDDELYSYYGYLSEAKRAVARLSLSNRLDVEQCFLPYVALVQFYRAPDTIEETKSQRIDRLHRIGSSIDDPTESQRALVRALQLLNIDHSGVIGAIYNEFLPIIASMKHTVSLPAFVQHERDIVESWLSSSFGTQTVECARIIAEAVYDLKILTSSPKFFGVRNVEESAHQRSITFQARSSEWEAHCGADKVIRSPTRSIVYTLGGSLYKIGSLFERLLTTKQNHWNNMSYSATIALGLKPRSLSGVTLDALRAAREAIEVVASRIDTIQVDALHESLLIFVELVENDAFRGLVEGAFQLGQYGIKLLRYISIPDQSAERMKLIRRIVSYWWVCRTSPLSRKVMIEYMQQVSDEGLKQMTEAWLAYAKAYDRFKTQASSEQALIGYLPGSVLQTSVDDVPRLLEWMYGYSNDAMWTLPTALAVLPKFSAETVTDIFRIMGHPASNILELTRRVSGAYRTVVLPYVVQQGIATAMSLGPLFELPQLTFRALRSLGPRDDELRDEVVETANAFVDFVHCMGEPNGELFVLDSLFEGVRSMLSHVELSKRNRTPTAVLLHWLNVVRLGLGEHCDALRARDLDHRLSPSNIPADLSFQ